MGASKCPLGPLTPAVSVSTVGVMAQTQLASRTLPSRRPQRPRMLTVELLPSLAKRQDTLMSHFKYPVIHRKFPTLHTILNCLIK